MLWLFICKLPEAPSRCIPLASLLEILHTDSFTLAAEGTAPFLIFFYTHLLPQAPPRVVITLSVSGAVCLQAPESLICLGSQLWHAWEGQGKEMGGSSHLTTNLSSPPFSFSPHPLPSPIPTKGRIMLHRLERIALEVWFGNFFYFFFFPFKWNTLRVSPVSMCSQRSGVVITKGRVCMCACLQCVFACSRVLMCGRVVSSGMHLWAGRNYTTTSKYPCILFAVPEDFTAAWSFML